MPVIQIDTGRDIVDKVNWITGSFSINGASKSKYNIETSGLQIKGRGNSTWELEKKGYSLKLNEKSNLFGIANGKHKQYALIPNYSDKSLIRNELAYLLGSKGYFDNLDWTPHTQQVNLFLNGEYLGIYLLTERIKIDDKIIDIGDISKKDVVTSATDAGWIVEVNARLDEQHNWTTLYGLDISLKDPDNFDNYQVIEIYINSVEEVLFGPNWLDADNGWRKYINEESLIDWYLVNELSKNNDSTGYSSIYMFFDDKGDKKIHLGPIWDFDISFGNINYGDCANPEGWWTKKGIWLKRLFKDPVFVSNVKKRWNEVSKNIDAYTLVTTLSSNLNTDVDENFAKWDVLGKYVWPNSSGYETRDTYVKEVTYLAEWFESRKRWISENIILL